MRSGTWSGPRSLDNVRVTVNGTVRPVRSVQVDSGMSDGHPLAQNKQRWCVESKIEWVAPPLVFSSAPHAFGVGTEWLPKAGDTVVIETGDGALGQWWVQHTGVIDDTTGSFADGTAASTTVDQVEELDATINFGALLRRMTPAEDGLDYRNIDLQSTYFVDRILRTVQGDTGGGWHATPPRTWQTLASAPNQGSLWPEVGTLRSTGAALPSWFRTEYGVAPTGYSVDVRMIGTTTEPILSAYIGTNAGTYGDIRVTDADGYGMLLGSDPVTDEIVFGYANPNRTQYRVPRNGARRAAVYFKRTGTSTQTAILRVDDGREITQAMTATGFPSSWAADRVLVNTSARLGWWMVEGTKTASQRWDTINHVPTARLRGVGFDMPLWTASWDMPFETASEWLEQQVDAELAAMWLDEDGVMQWAGRGAVDAEPVAATIASDAVMVGDIQWEQRRRALARSVWVNYEEANVRSLTGAARQTCWENASIDLGPGEEITITASVPGDEDWVGVDLQPQILNENSVPLGVRTGSRFGGTQFEDGAGENGQTWAIFLDCTMTLNGLRAVDIYYAPWPGQPPTGHRIKSAIPNLAAETAPASLLSAWHSGNPALILRSDAITKWVEGERSVAGGTNGPSRYVHDMGRRVQSVVGGDQIGAVLTYLQGVVADSTKPTVTGMTVAHDPRYQIGDKLRVQDTAVTGLDFDILIQNRSVRVDKSTFTDTITGRTTLVRTEPAPGSRVDPAGPTALTPASDWKREVA